MHLVCKKQENRLARDYPSTQIPCILCVEDGRSEAYGGYVFSLMAISAAVGTVTGDKSYPKQLLHLQSLCDLGNCSPTL